MKSNIYFPSLNGVRAIAAIMVIFHHIEHSVYLAKEYLTKRTDQFRPPDFYNEI